MEAPSSIFYLLSSIVYRLSSIVCAALILLAILARMPALNAGRTVLLTEGTTYATLAANLIAGRGYVGIIGVRDLFPPPGYPVLMAAFSWLAGDAATAGLWISFILGALLPVPVYVLVARAFNRGAAGWAGLVIALHPLLVRYSGLVWSEMLYTWLLWAGLAGVVALLIDERRRTEDGGRKTEDRGSRIEDREWRGGIFILHRLALHLRSSIVCRLPSIVHRPLAAFPAGLLLAAAYLTRAEGAVVFAVVTLWFLGMAVIGRQRRCLTMLMAVVLGFGILALPYMGWLSANSGRLMLESKSRLNFVITDRMAQGMDYSEAAYGLDRNGQPAGPFLQRAEAIPAPPLSLSIEFHALQRGLSEFVHLLRTFVSPALLALLALAGYLYTLFNHPKLAITFLASLALVQVLVISLVPLVYTRYLAALVPFVAIGAGLALAEGQRRISALAQPKSLPGLLLGFFVPALILAAALWSVPRIDSTSIDLTQDIDQARAGAWLHSQDPNPAKRILDVHSQLPYYAGGVHVPMPEASPDQVLAYALAQKVDYIAVTPRKLSGRPHLVAWAKGTPLPAQFVRIYSDPTTGSGLAIYRVTR